MADINKNIREEFELWARKMSMDLEYQNIPGVGQFYECPRTLLALEAWQASREAVTTWEPMASCPKHVDVLFYNERNGVIPGRYTDADSFMTDKDRDEWDGGEEAQFRIDAFGFGHWGVDRMEGCEAPTLWMPYPEHGDEKE